MIKLDRHPDFPDKMFMCACGAMFKTPDEINKCKERGHLPKRKETNARAETWDNRGPELLAAAKAAVKRPCSHPIGMGGSPARIQWEDDCFAYGKLMSAIAACEAIEDKPE